MVIKFLFCKISLPWTSRCVLIDFSHLMRFLCCNLFVMFCLTLSAISANVLPSTFTLYWWSIPSQIPCNHLLQWFSRMFLSVYPRDTPTVGVSHGYTDSSQNSRESPCGTNFYEVPILPTFMDYCMEVGDCLSKFCESSQNSRSLSTYTPLVLTAKYYDIFKCLFLGTGCLSQGERRGKEKSLSKKRVPTDRYVWGFNSQSAWPYIFRTCTDYDKVVFIPNRHLCCIKIKEFCSVV